MTVSPRYDPGMTIEPIWFLIIVVVVANWIALYFVIKAAVKNALHEDRVFQAEVRKRTVGGEHGKP